MGNAGIDHQMGSQIVIQQPVKNARSRYGRLGVIVGSMLIRRHGSALGLGQGSLEGFTLEQANHVSLQLFGATAGEIDAQAR